MDDYITDQRPDILYSLIRVEVERPSAIPAMLPHRFLWHQPYSKTGAWPSAISLPYVKIPHYIFQLIWKLHARKQDV